MILSKFGLVFINAIVSSAFPIAINFAPSSYASLWVKAESSTIFLSVISTLALILSDKSEELLPQTLLRTVRETYTSYGSSKLSPSL